MVAEKIKGMPERLQGTLLLVITAMLWSSGGFFIKWVTWNPLAIAGIRSGIAGLFLWFFFRRPSLNWSFAQFTGALAYAVTMLSFVAATKLTTAANAILLQYTAPVYVAILGIFFLKEKPHLYDWLTIAFVIGGMVLFFQDRVGTGGLYGNLLGIVSGISMAVMIVALRRQKDGSPLGSVLLGNGLTFVCGLPFVFDNPPGAAGWAAIAGLGCLQLGLPYALYTIAIKKVTALEASVITVIEPILNPVWVFLFLGEVPGPWSLLGGAVILAAITARYILPVLKSSGAALSVDSRRSK
ncbi:Hypothetical protein LUCI_2023 [Lucifera butyrica]|uniref:EamA domain-containing protein n=1 Tax=Lucifera butyrica TaxID=1351585 RepID=A0A498R7B3_9FIRM|nr:DMT family transporter [Lucifera butyrica]VBB06787.1 Hypothetical protein LUCI_2023 [Lucifera butyrica]